MNSRILRQLFYVVIYFKVGVDQRTRDSGCTGSIVNAILSQMNAINENNAILIKELTPCGAHTNKLLGKRISFPRTLLCAGCKTHRHMIYDRCRHSALCHAQFPRKRSTLMPDYDGHNKSAFVPHWLAIPRNGFIY